MKHSSPSSMSEICEPKRVNPCSGNWDSVLKKLYVDLFNLIVESRIPGINERGYGDGIHCPPLMGPNVHICDLSNPECQKHQRLIYHLQRALKQYVFEIEVLMLPDCCSESKLNDRIQNKEYILLERWSMKCSNSKTNISIEVTELLRAVRSFLHFSQISAWLSLTKGKSPSNIYYWIKPTADPSSTQFNSNPEVHSFPVCKISEGLYGIITVNYPTRKQYIPIIPCSKHPPIPELTFRTITEDSTLPQTIPINSHVVKQLQTTCDTQQTILAVKHCTTVSEPLSVLKSVKETNRIFNQKCSNTQNTLNSVSKCASQENACIGQRSLSVHFPQQESTLNLLNKVLLPSICTLDSTSVEISHQCLTEHPETESHDKSSKLSGSDMCIVSKSPNLILQSGETSQPVSNAFYSPSLLKLQQKCLSPIKSLKRKQVEELEMQVIPEKNRTLKEELLSYSNEYIPSSSCQTINRKRFKRRNLCDFPVNSSSQKLINQKIKNKVECNINTDILNTFKQDEENLSLYECKSLSLVKSKNMKPSGILLQHEFKESLIPKEQQKFLKDTEIQESKTKSLSYCQKKYNSDKKLLENAYKKMENCDSNLLYKHAEKISKCSKQLEKNFSCEKFIKDVKDSKLEKCSQDINVSFLTPKHLTNFHRNENFSQISEKKIAKTLNKFQINETSCIEHESDSTNILNKILCTCRNNVTNSKLGLGRKNQKSMNPYFQEFKLKKHFSKMLHKSKNLMQIDNLNLATINAKDILFSMKSSSIDIHTNAFNCSNDSKRSRSHKRPRKEELEICDTSCKPFKKLCIEAQSKSEYENSSKLTKSNNQDSIINEIISQTCENKPYSSEPTDICFSSQRKLEEKSGITANSVPLTNYSKNISSAEYESSKNLGGEEPSFKSPMQISSETKNASINKCQLVSNFCTVLPQKATPYLDCFPRHKLKFARGRKLLGNFEESILKGCFLPASYVSGFNVEIGASGSFCPNHLTLPAEVTFYELDNLCSGITPYMAQVSLKDTEYCLPKKGAVQVTLFNPSETVVKMFVLNYDLSDMPPMCHTFIRQKTYYMPIGSTECPSSQKWLRFIIHLRFASSKTGKVYLHKDFKIVVLNKSNDDAASEFSQEPHELRSFLHVPINPKFSCI